MNRIKLAVIADDFTGGADAIKKVHDVLLFLEQYQVEHLYYKYCSTFDSTPKGNIWPVMDFLLDYYDLTYITSLIDAQKSPLLIYSDAVLKDFKTEKNPLHFIQQLRK